MALNRSVWSLHIVAVKGIPIRIHFTFFFLLIWIGLEEYLAGSAPFKEMLFVLSIFFCVLLHELGHAIVARQFRIRTRDIVLYPIGGIASLLDEPKAKAELFIAMAGPLVNLMIALLLAFFIEFEGTTVYLRDEYIARIYIGNLALAIFNLIPAFPLDGGRILRAALALLSVKRATLVAARISQILSMLMGIFALYIGHPILIVISALVFVTAVEEHLREKTKAAAAGYSVKDIMTEISRVECFTHGTTVSRALQISLRSLQNVFPVLHENIVIGVVDKESLLQHGALDEEESYVSNIMSRDFLTVPPDEELTKAFEKFQLSGLAALLVVQDEKLVGLVYKEKLSEYLLVHGVRAHIRLNRDLYHDEEI